MSLLEILRRTAFEAAAEHVLQGVSRREVEVRGELDHFAAVMRGVVGRMVHGLFGRTGDF